MVASEAGIKGGLCVAADGHVHTTFKHDPSTLRLSSANPAMQNVPRSARYMFVAPPGWVFWALDYAGIENILVGWLAGSQRYMRLSILDMHTFYTAYAKHELDGELPAADLPQESWPDDQLRAYLKTLKARWPEERQANKKQVHGGNYMEGPFMVQEQILKDLHKVVPIKRIRRLQGLYFGLFPEIRVWQERVTGLREASASYPWEGAYQKGCLRTPFGNIHRYYDILTHVKGPKGWELRYSADAKRAVAFVPQSMARVILTRAAQRLSEAVQRTLRLFIHDEMLGLCVKSDAERCMQEAKCQMERPVPELDGLVLPTEAKTGQSWGEMN